MRHLLSPAGINTGRRGARRLAPLLALALLAAACGKDDPAGPSQQVMPDFTLVDVNPTSATVAQTVSPRDYLQKVSAWYFGHAT